MIYNKFKRACSLIYYKVVVFLVWRICRHGENRRNRDSKL